ncbi:MAG: DNA-3-methyladenine glycosylase 2 family protein [Hyphomicrobiaceae bacterium]
MPARYPKAARLRTIETNADLEAGIKALRRKCAVVRRMHERVGLPPLRRRPGGLAGLARIVIGQQVSVASAAAIWGRTEQVVGTFEADRLLALTDDDWRAAGLSTGKIRTLRAIGAAVAEGRLDLDQLAALDDEDIAARLTAISGIGPWTSDVYIMFCIGRADGFAAGDLALQVALQMASGMATRPRAQELADFAERWRPWRGVAARLLWDYYRIEKQGNSGVPV